jgi:predicted nucleotidyltransferase component of viral defense system
MRDALRQIVQEITLVALARAGFFNHAAFYGGTALRIFHGLERFSEDLDFSLIEPNDSFDLAEYIPYVRDELGSYGFEMSVEQKVKTKSSAVQSAFIKGGTLIHLIKITAAVPPVSGVSVNEQLKIKFEIDTNPPAFAGFEMKYRLEPISYAVRLYDKPSLFAGKLHALLCRNWKERIKGRDFFDFVWYLAHDIPVNCAHLEARMRQSGHWSSSAVLTISDILALIDGRFIESNIVRAKEDVVPFIKDTRELDVWNRDFFMAISQEHLRGI